MTHAPKLHAVALVGALSALAATAWATNDPIADASYLPAANAAPVAAPDPVAVDESLAPNEKVVTEAPVVDRSAPAPQRVARTGITVEDRRMSEDQRIQSLVMDKLAASRNISGKIGVESNSAVVRLTGYTITAGQAYRAGREAGSVMGVKYVQNEIRPRIGGSV